MSVQKTAIYIDQFVQVFERRETILRQAVTTDTETRAGSVLFLVAGSNNRSAVTRGSNGLIPPADDSQTQVTVTFAEAQDLKEYTNFDIFTAQSNQLAIMQMNGAAVINRDIDAKIIAAIATGSVDLGAIGTMTKTVANQISTKLRNAFAGESDRGNLYALLTPAAWAYMTDITSFANTQYSATGGKVEEGVPQIGMWKYWMGINWGEHSGLTNTGLSTAVCLAWHKAAVGHALASGYPTAMIGRDEKQDTSWSRHTAYHGAVKLQNSGIVKFTHDDSGIS